MTCRFHVEPIKPFGAILRPNKETDARLESPQVPIFDDKLRELLLQYKLLTFRGFQSFKSKDALAEYANGWGQLLEWNFGTVFEVVEKDDAQNYLFTSGSVPFHWDGAFAAEVPWLQIFQCVEAPAVNGLHAGGETLFCDTSAVWTKLTVAEKALWRQIELEYATQQVAHYGGRIRAKLVGSHPVTNQAVIRFNEPANETTVDLNTPEVKLHGVPNDQVESLMRDIVTRVYDPDTLVAHAWQPGDCVIADNFVLLHGRSAYQTKLPRRLWRVHVLLPKGDSHERSEIQS